MVHRTEAFDIAGSAEFRMWRAGTTFFRNRYTPGERSSRRPNWNLQRPHRSSRFRLSDRRRTPATVPRGAVFGRGAKTLKSQECSTAIKPISAPRCLDRQQACAASRRRREAGSPVPAAVSRRAQTVLRQWPRKARFYSATMTVPVDNSSLSQAPDIAASEPHHVQVFIGAAERQP